jgi:hypothetical protein
MKTMVEGQTHDGGSTSFTLVFLFNGGAAAFREAIASCRSIACLTVGRDVAGGRLLDSRR